MPSNDETIQHLQAAIGEANTFQRYVANMSPALDSVLTAVAQTDGTVSTIRGHVHNALGSGTALEQIIQYTDDGRRAIQEDVIMAQEAVSDAVGRSSQLITELESALQRALAAGQ